MAQKKQLIDTLKRILKLHGLTYSDVAQHLQLSEASIKRLFAGYNMSLARLDQICQMMTIELSDLVLEMQAQHTQLLSALTKQQEQQIADDVGLLLVTVCVLNRWTVAELTTHFHLSEPECIRYLATLDRLKLIELLPQNKIKLRVSANFKWLQDGPIQRFFQQKLAADFFQSQFNQAGEQLLVINAMLSHESQAILNRKLTQLAREFEQLNRDDATLALEQKIGITTVLATRSWQYGLFEPMRK